MRSFFSSVSAKALTSNCGMIQLMSRVSAVRRPAKPCHANTLVENYKMAEVGAARHSHLFGKASLSDHSNRVPASGIRVDQAEESANGLKGSRPENRGVPGISGGKSSGDCWLAHVGEKSLLMQSALKDYKFHQYLHKVHIKFLPY